LLFKLNMVISLGDNDSAISTAMKNRNYKKAIKYCDKVLRKIPVSLKANFNKGLALLSINNGELSQLKCSARYRNLKDAIPGTGDGLTCKTGFSVLFIADGYEIMYNYFKN